MVNCQHCGKEITPKVKICPHCNEPNPIPYVDYSSYFKNEKNEKIN